MRIRSVKPKHISDQQILEWIICGLLVIEDIWSRQPRCIFRGRELKPTIQYSNGRHKLPNNPRHRWELSFQRKKRSIVCNKLIWMFMYLETPQEHEDIHHFDEDRFNNAWFNLIRMTEDAHIDLHRKAGNVSTGRLEAIHPTWT